MKLRSAIVIHIARFAFFSFANIRYFERHLHTYNYFKSLFATSYFPSDFEYIRSSFSVHPPHLASINLSLLNSTLGLDPPSPSPVLQIPPPQTSFQPSQTIRQNLQRYWVNLMSGVYVQWYFRQL